MRYIKTLYALFFIVFAQWLHAEQRTTDPEYDEIYSVISSIFENLPKAKQKLDSYYVAIDSIKSPKKYCLVLRGLGNVAYYEHDYDKAFEYYNRNLVCNKACNNYDGRWKIHYNLALIYNRRNDIVKTADQIQKALFSSQEQKDTVGISYAVNYLGVLYRNIGMYKESELHYREVINIARKNRDTARLNITLAHLWKVLFNQNRFTEADEILLELEGLAKKEGFRANFEYLLALSTKYLDVNPQKSLQSIQTLGQLIKEANVDEQFMNYALLLGRAYLNLGQLDKAEESLLQVEQYLEKTNYTEPKQELYHSLNQLYELKNNSRLAMKYLQMETQIQDNMNRQRLVLVVSDIGVSYEVSKKDRVLLKQQLELKEQKYVELHHKMKASLWIIVCLIMIYILAGYLSMQARDKKKKFGKLLEQKNSLIKKAYTEKSSFIDALCHELRTPCFTMGGIVELLKTPLSTSEFNNNLNTLSVVANYFSFFIENVLLLQEGSFMKLENKPIHIRKMVEGTYAALLAIGSTNDFELHIDSNIPTLYGDASKLNKVLFNLIHNANKYTRHGTVRLEVIKQQETSQEMVLLIRVKDTGIGIKPEEMEQIFEKFNYEATRSEGVGIGLNVVKMLLGLMGTELQLSSIPGEGSTFSFELTLRRRTSFATEDISKLVNKGFK